MQYDYDVAVIGGGTAGLAAARVAASHGAKVALVESEKIGGSALWRGAVPFHTALKTAKVMEMVSRSEEFGVHLEKPRLIWSALRLRIKDVQDEIRGHHRAALAQNSVQVVPGRARFLDAQTIQIEMGAEISQICARKFILASGSRLQTPSFPGLETSGFIHAHQLFERPNLPRTLLFLGGGATACEMAQAFARFGSKVTLVCPEESLLPDEDADVGEKLAQILGAQGVQIHLNARIQKIEGDDNGKTVWVQNGEPLKAGTLIVAAAKEPSLGELNCEAAGIENAGGALKINEFGRTSAPHIWACGSVAGRDFSSHNSRFAGQIVGFNAVSDAKDARKLDNGVAVSVTFCDPEVARVGPTREQLTREVADLETWEVPYNTLNRAVIEGETSGFARVYTTSEGQIVGATLFGPHASETLAALVEAVRKKANWRDLTSETFPSLTHSEILAGIGELALRKMEEEQQKQWRAKSGVEAAF